MSDLEQILSIMRELQEENRRLREKIQDLTETNRSPTPLSTLMSRGLGNLPSKHELSNSTKNTLDKAVDLVLEYARVTGWH